MELIYSYLWNMNSTFSQKANFILELFEVS